MNAWYKAEAYNVKVRPEHSFLKNLINKILLRFFVAKEFLRYFLFKYKIEMPHLELVLTTRCSLKCKNCFNMMQYFTNEQQYDADFETIKKDIDTLTNAISKVTAFHILGGEPLIVKNLPEILSYLCTKKQLPNIIIITNSTQKINNELLEVLKNNRNKTKISISDYRSNAEIAKRIHIDENVEILKANNINYEIRGSGAGGYYQWKETGRIYKRGRDKEAIRANFLACQMPCVSLLDSKLFVCPVASSLSKLLAAPAKDSTKNSLATAAELLDSNSSSDPKILNTPASSLNAIEKSVANNAGGGGAMIDREDYIELHRYSEKKDLQNRILEFYAKDYFSCCDYCRDMSKPARDIAPALQIKQILSVSKE